MSWNQIEKRRERSWPVMSWSCVINLNFFSYNKTSRFCRFHLIKSSSFWLTTWHVQFAQSFLMFDDPSFLCCWIFWLCIDIASTVVLISCWCDYYQILNHNLMEPLNTKFNFIFLFLCFLAQDEAWLEATESKCCFFFWFINFRTLRKKKL